MSLIIFDSPSKYSSVYVEDIVNLKERSFIGGRGRENPEPACRYEYLYRKEPAGSIRNIFKLLSMTTKHGAYVADIGSARQSSLQKSAQYALYGDKPVLLSFRYCSGSI